MTTTTTNSGTISTGIVTVSGSEIYTNTTTGLITVPVTGTEYGAGIINSGTILNDAASTGATTAVSLNDTGSVAGSATNIDNNQGALIQGTDYGLDIEAASSSLTLSITNQGTILGGAGDGSTNGVAIYGIANTTLVNNTGGVISGDDTGIRLGVPAANTSPVSYSITNYGTITGINNTGIDLASGGTVTNNHGAVITGYWAGVAMVVNSSSTLVTTGGTVITDGTIIGQNGIAIQLAAPVSMEPYSNQVQIGTDAVFEGIVDGGVPASSTVASSALVLMAATSSDTNTTGKLSGIGTEFVNFSALSLANGAGWIIDGGLDSISTVSLGAASELTLAGTGTLTSSQTIAFNNGGSRLRLGTGYALNAGNLQLGQGADTIQVADQSFNLAAGSGALTFIAGSGKSTITGGSGTLIFTGGSGASTVTSGAGGGTLSGGSDGGNLLVAGGGNTQLRAAGNGDQLFGASHGSSTLIGAANGQVSLVGGTGTALIVAGSGGGAIYAGSGSSTVFGSNAGGLVGTGTGNSLLVNMGRSTIAGETGTSTIFGSQSGQNTVFGGTGAMQLAETGGSNLVMGGGGAMTLFGGVGNDTILTGQGGIMTAFLGGNQNLVGLGSANATVVAGSGSDVFAVTAGAGGGTTTIYDFDTSKDKIGLFGYQPSEISQNVTNGSLQISLSDHTVITLSGVTNAQGSILAT
ncbi:beta strand repeat-containing protein [Granulibacter bethesdensis]|uniref:beta strand repeat-containing protein n=1 Tax=Granulibacter bethesdensis TaxID=364410 RepID=UPI0003F1CEC2|nr:calcium-binding protein [Granulibacter bethesdensis]AHJ66127.1 Adhesin family protein [Granulibacter bethesdensis CGDNIH4]